MSMRDPGRPGRNPLFEQGDSGPDPEPQPRTEVPPELTGLAAMAVALQAAGPEAAEHLVTAAHELVLAIKVVVDATESVLADQRATFAAAHEEAEAAGPHLRSVDGT